MTSPGTSWMLMTQFSQGNMKQGWNSNPKMNCFCIKTVQRHWRPFKIKLLNRKLVIYKYNCPRQTTFHGCNSLMEFVPFLPFGKRILAFKHSWSSEARKGSSILTCPLEGRAAGFLGLVVLKALTQNAGRGFLFYFLIKNFSNYVCSH